MRRCGFIPRKTSFWLDATLKKGEEVTYDYGTTECNPKWRMECRCGLECCRGTITGDEWKNPEFRAKFKGHFFTGVQKLIDEFEKEEQAKADAAATAEAEKREEKVATADATDVAAPLAKAGKRKTSAADKEVTENQNKAIKEKKFKTKKAPRKASPPAKI